MADALHRGWTVVLVPTALAASLMVLAQAVASHATAYTNAPQELGRLLETLRDAATETESYERDVSRVTNMEVKVRLGSLLREIQKTNVSLGSDLAMLLEGDQKEEKRSQALVGLPHIKDRMFMPSMKLSARLFWLEYRTDLHDRLRRLDTLKMRFLVVYMGAVASNAQAAATTSIAAVAAAASVTQNQHQPKPITPPMTPKKDERMMLMQSVAAAAAAAGEAPKLRNTRGPSRRAHVKRSSTSASRARSPPGSVLSVASTPPARTSERQDQTPTKSSSSVVSAGGNPKTDGWTGVIAELQSSPVMEARRESIETAMKSPSL
ncbi:hypothetical protein CFIMG_007428RA00001 [Ceratocystis fimbriata CBS 114723]|uniref:Fungal N-terminal domain-containing protein n=1 Tax=Ceratocystis fimbriata CBS 114723 TaxID=1035309 RepID=A0A2C5WW86_9PEZI|nr:hypothetical protein CFIMG_007428RA00001 [Ceratocystis fimbriata CBS 114723]